MASFCKLNFSPHVNKIICKEAHVFAPISNQANMHLLFTIDTGEEFSSCLINALYLSLSLADLVNQIYN